MTWIPSHKGITGNEKADSIAKEAVSSGFRCLFLIPYTDLFVSLKEKMFKRLESYLDDSFRLKGIKYAKHFYTNGKKPWFDKPGFRREQIVLINRIRSDHYNLNQSLHRKGYINSKSCPCGDPYQDVNHIIYNCPLTKEKSEKLRNYLSSANLDSPPDIFPVLRNPSAKLCRLILAFFKSIGVIP